MALSDLLEKISQETGLIISHLEQEFNKELQKLEEEYETKKKEIDLNMYKKIDEKSNIMLKKAKDLAIREGKNELLTAKRKIIENLLNIAIEEISNSSDYTKIIKTLIERSDLGDESEIIAAKGKEKETKEALASSNKKAKISEKTINIKGGFIIKTKLIEIDNSFETIIKKQLKEDLEIKLNKILF